MPDYDPKTIEPKWQAAWQASKQHEAPDTASGDNYMVLTEFPYPSGNLHIGHWYAFALPDIHARYLRMHGKNVLYPIGFDAFGLPAENAAIKRGINPRQWTEDNIAYMSKQLQSMGATFDWSRVVSTIDPEYYRWTQWIFLKMYEKGLAYRAKTTVNWCPKDKTVLANEQVVNGCCERCDTPVEQKEIEQWMFKITAYADRLIDDLKELDWPATTKIAQANWIGRSNGTRIKFQLSDIPGQDDAKHFVEVFTTRPDTLFGVSAVVISPEVAKKWLDVGWQASDEVKAYVTTSLTKRELDRLEQTAEKTGVSAEINALHPVSGEKIPVWVADYILGHYGTGAVMMVPAHDERDFEFAQKFNVPLRPVIAAPDTAASDSSAYVGEGTLINSGEFNGLTSQEARLAITAWLSKHEHGQAEVTYKLHDWVLSRQRYWGVPIPMIYCAACAAKDGTGYHPVPDEQLPVELPELDNFLPSDDGRSPLSRATEWLKVPCPACGQDAQRETDTMDTFVDSSWYFMRYTDPRNSKQFADPAKMKQWLPVPLYIGGAEHNTMHLLYSRFFTKVLFDLGYVHCHEPYLKRVNRGLILGPDGQKMSKSRGNVIDPDVEVQNFGADTVRLYLAFMAPYEQGGPWDPNGIHGVQRFLKRIWKLVQRTSDSSLPEADAAAYQLPLQQTIKKVGEDIAALQFNTAISALMKLLNDLEAATKDNSRLSDETVSIVLKLVAPLAPHIAEELWHSVLGQTTSIHLEVWPTHDEALLAQQQVKIAVQINGKVRGAVEASPDATQAEIESVAKAVANIAKYLEGQTIQKVIYVPQRLLNFVVKAE